MKRIFQETAVFNEEKRYEVALPWVQKHAPLTSNKALVLQRLENTRKSLEKKGLFDRYGEIFQEWEREGIIERVPESEMENPSHYLPHRPVVKPDSLSTKVRPVYDAAARERNSPSLNQCLEKGPNLMELIPIILLGFRRGKVGVIADIKAAFLQISVMCRDRDYLRFLWYLGGKILVYRYRRVVFGLTWSQFLLGATIELQLGKNLNNEWRQQRR